MAHKEKAQYISYYAVGSAARKLERQPEKSKRTEPIRQAAMPERKVTLYVDPVAAVGTLVALALLVCMVAGVIQLNQVNAEIQAVESYITSLENQRTVLRDEYRESYDLEEIRIQAEALGMVDRSQVQHISVTVPQPTVEEEPTGWWGSLMAQIKDLFA